MVVAECRQRNGRQTMKILVYDGKHDQAYWLADSPKQETAAFRRMFELMHELEYYESVPPEAGKERDLYLLAKDGDDKSLKKFLQMRRNNEYEDWYFVYAEDPIEA